MAAICKEAEAAVHYMPLFMELRKLTPRLTDLAEIVASRYTRAGERRAWKPRARGPIPRPRVCLAPRASAVNAAFQSDARCIIALTTTARPGASWPSTTRPAPITVTRFARRRARREAVLRRAPWHAAPADAHARRHLNRCFPSSSRSRANRVTGRRTWRTAFMGARARAASPAPCLMPPRAHSTPSTGKEISFRATGSLPCRAGGRRSTNNAHPDRRVIDGLRRGIAAALPSSYIAARRAPLLASA